jgi:hypothetical protein
VKNSACRLLVLRADPPARRRSSTLGVIYAQSCRIDQAARLWERALQGNPALEGTALNLAQIHPPAQARAIL